ncbi:GntR family transcriptional regulator [Streptomyces sp. NPDC048717]|uniref:GntR family transcriptional regulator n=1 Tax=Streptomyces sp. NPDC048717 TaxID=3154928 RepID=UPI003428571E
MTGAGTAAAGGPGGGPLRDLVCDGLRERIATGRLRPGDRLVEREIAAEFGVSRVPVREAIRTLLVEGLLRAVSPRRIVVRELTRKDVENLFDMREALEVLAVRRATECRTDIELRTLSRLLAESRAAASAGDPERLARADAAFHARVVRMSRNELLVTALCTLEGRLRWLSRQVGERGGPGPRWEEHRMLYEAIGTGDAEAAARLAFARVRHCRRVTLAVLFDV